ncbi:MAG: DUF4271 domain-containing protein [Flavobacteriales bacterium]
MVLTLLSQFELVERDTQLNSYLLVVVLLCFALVGVARVAQPDLIAQTFAGFFKIKRIENAGFEGTKLQPSMTALILLNYMISFTSCVFLSIYQNENLLQTLGISMLIVGTFMMLHALNFRLIYFLSGERQILETMSAVNKQIWSFGGFVLLAIALLWILNQEHQASFSKLFFVCFAFLMIWRLIKGLRLAIQLRYRWYYLILYLCTLEILPLLILSKVAWYYFGVNGLYIIR